MTFVADHSDLVIIAGAALVALAIVIAGALHVVGALKTLRKRVAAYADLPVLATIESSMERLSRTGETFEALNEVLARGNAALERIGAARDSLWTSLRIVSSWLR